MLSKWQWLLNQLTRTLWVRASLFAVLAIVTALVAIPIQNMFTGSLPFSVGSDSVGSILNILASSMLAVTTFSLSVMVTAYGAASNGATPRATQLVHQDTITQNVLATFLGSLLYSLVGIIALSTDLYGENGHLNELACCDDLELAVLVEPGSFVQPAEVVLWCRKKISEETCEKMRPAFSIGVDRSFDQDPRFGLEVLAKIASRALSPSVNDAGTAIDVFSRSVRLMCLWKEHKCLEDEDENIHFPNVRIAALSTNDLFDYIYSPIARDGAGLVEV